ncbi:hypothetical protein BX616_002320 [Lobosporangium transversale]|nr:hypothetical protein BX616_002320 [Lobosporangium transversale]
MADPLTMFIVIRKDLIKVSVLLYPVSSWSCSSNAPINSLIESLICTYSSTGSNRRLAGRRAAVLYKTQELKDTREYLADLNNMHKVVLEVKNLPQLESLAASLSALDVPHVTWREQPEDILTCLSTSPIRRNQEVKDAFKKCSLFRS